MVERLGEMRKGSRERIEKREETNRQFEKKEGLRAPPFLELSTRSDPAM